ncbi:hypothetical protein [Liquorilactobacillus hordei]|uniref:Uncharacterized protein n=1 Tax=Liquorilactobacillus hordei DSM 19519 TaxID=1423759 RepID=A0A0R1MJ63_9LACO|nr:hypothetical protein [Liquorilactobacillus hordei]KRL08012.1 hypothetical protein FC92_GL001084 [Liquorilactobacillus hordei DSM 19519]QYH51041.1 hypothetical protein G6O70_00310 [Liquorilactobacillus hordei DSM 19519]
MKAYSVEVISDPDYGQEIIWAENTKEARKKARCTEMAGNADGFLDLRVTRSSGFDDCENMNADDFAWKQHQEGWIWFEIPQLNNEDLTKEEFIKLVKEI